MGLTSALRTLKATTSSELKMIIRYVSVGGLIGFNIAVPLFFVFTSWIVAEIMATTGSTYFVSLTGTGDYVGYTIVGFAFNSLIFSSVFGGGSAIRGEQEFGTAELVFVTPSNKVVWLLGKMFAGQIYGSISFVTVFVLGTLMFGMEPVAAPNILWAVISIILTMVALSSFGFILAGVCFFAKQEDAITQALWPVMVFFCGLAFPVEILPQWGQVISWIFPLTHGVNATRGAILFGMGISSPALAGSLLTLLGQTAVLLPVGILLYLRLEKKARKSGTLGVY